MSFFKKIFHILIIIILLSACACADSILTGIEVKDLYSNNSKIASDEGDVITIVLTENAQAQKSMKTQTKDNSKQNSFSGQGILSFFKGLGMDENSNSSQENSTAQTSAFKATMSARVVEVLPKGHLKIEGTKTMIINNEKQEIKIKGIIRREDIDQDNTIKSPKIANAELEVTGLAGKKKGATRGLLKTILGIFF